MPKSPSWLMIAPRPAPSRSVGPVAWVRTQLLGSPFNIALTLLIMLLAVWKLPDVISWALVHAVARAANGGRWAAGGQVDAISAYAIPVGTSRAAVYTEGMFNVDALNWPADTTEVAAMTAMTGDVKYRKLLYSDKRTGDESDEVGPGNEAGQVIP